MIKIKTVIFFIYYYQLATPVLSSVDCHLQAEAFRTYKSSSVRSPIHYMFSRIEEQFDKYQPHL
jgi:hypothetical protein